MNNLIPAELGLEIDGTGGIIPFDIIHTEYIEDKYKSELISYLFNTRFKLERTFTRISQESQVYLMEIIIYNK